MAVKFDDDALYIAILAVHIVFLVTATATAGSAAAIGSTPAITAVASTAAAGSATIILSCIDCGGRRSNMSVRSFIRRTVSLFNSDMLLMANLSALLLLAKRALRMEPRQTRI
jgi:hypothetical protein